MRKALVVATSLDLAEFREWIEHELHGYQDADVPDYRKTKGKVIFHSRFGDAQMVIGDPEIDDMISSFDYRAPIGPIEATNTGQSPFLVYEYLPKEQHVLRSMFPLARGFPQLHVPASCVAIILNQVRNTILGWSLKLRKDDIKGEDMSFSVEEKRRAAQESPTLGNPANYFLFNSSIQINSSGASQQVRHG